MDVREALHRSRSYRRFYEETDVTDADLRIIADAARLSPSGRNIQALKFFITNDRELGSRIFPTLAWAGYLPELSYGSHMFQDMVEAEIFYSALWEDKRRLVYEPELFAGMENLFPQICPDLPDLFPMFRVTEPEGLYYWNDVLSGETLCGILEEEQKG